MMETKRLILNVALLKLLLSEKTADADTGKGTTDYSMRSF